MEYMAFHIQASTEMDNLAYQRELYRRHNLPQLWNNVISFRRLNQEIIDTPKWSLS